MKDGRHMYVCDRCGEDRDDREYPPKFKRADYLSPDGIPDIICSSCSEDAQGVVETAYEATNGG